MARRKQAPKDLTGIRPRGGTYQVRLFGGQDPVTGKQVMLTGSADDEDAAIKLRDKFRRQVAEATSARTSVTLGYLLDEWLSGHQVEETTRASYRVAIDNFIRRNPSFAPRSRGATTSGRMAARSTAFGPCRQRGRTSRSAAAIRRPMGHPAGPTTCTAVRSAPPLRKGFQFPADDEGKGKEVSLLDTFNV
jgi:hypothetical protein